MSQVLVAGQPFNPFRVFVGSFIPNALLRHTKISSSAKLVWARLAQYAGDDGMAHPRQTTLAYEAGLGERTVRMCLAELVREGFLRVVKPQVNNRISGSIRNDSYEFLFHPCFSAAGDHRQKLPVPPAKIAGGIYKVVEENPLRESTPLNPPRGGSPASGQPPNGKSNGQSDYDRARAAAVNALLDRIGKGLNGRSAPP